jgi:Nucleotidyltransferase of unknown function (DUF6036)
MQQVFNQDFIEFIEALNKEEVRYLLVGGYAVILHGYSRSTGDLDLWIEQSVENYRRLMKAFDTFGLPRSAIAEKHFLDNTEMDVFTFGKPPVSIDLMTAVKGLDFNTAYQSAVSITIQDMHVRILDLKSLIIAKQSSGRLKDLDDIEHLREDT